MTQRSTDTCGSKVLESFRRELHEILRQDDLFFGIEDNAVEDIAEIVSEDATRWLAVALAEAYMHDRKEACMNLALAYSRGQIAIVRKDIGQVLEWLLNHPHSTKTG